MNATRPSRRYSDVHDEKATGATYTPKRLADFVATKIVDAACELREGMEILDPAAGDGELIVALLEALSERGVERVVVHAFEASEEAARACIERVCPQFPKADVRIERGDFLEIVAQRAANTDLFSSKVLPNFDLIISNPPYVRTQIIGAKQAQALAARYGLAGRVDLYYAFVIAMGMVLKPTGTAGIITSNRFMTTKAGGSVRAGIRRAFDLQAVWDFGDTKLFDAAVLPAVILAHGAKSDPTSTVPMYSMYQTKEQPTERAADPIEAVALAGVVEISDGRRFEVVAGTLDDGGAVDGVWRIANGATDEWLATVQKNTWGTFGGINKIRVGVKTTADKVFIRTDWEDTQQEWRPELLKPLTTHHSARRFKAAQPSKPRHILYTHEVIGGKRKAVDIAKYPNSKAYLSLHRQTLEGRTYVIEAKRNWFEIWVPQDPASWPHPKLVFRDISEEPCFWIDLDGTVVNGDCYYIVASTPEQEALLWLALGVGNTTFIEEFYDHRFNNKLYAGRRRFITQYVEHFPLPDPTSELAGRIVEKAKLIYGLTPGEGISEHEAELDGLVRQAFGLEKKIAG